MKTVYALSAKGERECAAPRPTLPVELTGLLRMVDGQRTGDDLLAAVGRSAMTSGGLRWLTASGYIRPRIKAKSIPIERAPVTDPVIPPSPSLSSSTTSPSGAHSQTEICGALSDFMVQSIRRRLGEGGYAYRRQIERATSVSELLPHLNPLIDAIVTRAGPEAGAEFADTAAFILHPLQQEASAY